MSATRECATGFTQQARGYHARVEQPQRQLWRLESLPRPTFSLPYTIARLGDCFWLFVAGEHYQTLQTALRRRAVLAGGGIRGGAALKQAVGRVIVKAESLITLVASKGRRAGAAAAGRADRARLTGLGPIGREVRADRLRRVAGTEQRWNHRLNNAKIGGRIGGRASRQLDVEIQPGVKVALFE
jgi:hypothetical protein